MDIQINAKPLCTISDEFLPDVYQLLGKHSFTFHLDKSKQILNVVNPLHKYQIMLENKGGSVAFPLLQLMRDSLKHAGFHVWIIDKEEDRERCSEEWDRGKQSIWLTLQPPDGERKEIVVYYFLHQMKASRQLANLLVQNIARYSDIPIQGVSFHWKSGLSYIFPQPGHTLTQAGLVYGGFDCMGEEERQQLADGVVGTAMVFFGKKPLMELIKQLRLLEERQIEAGYHLPRPAASVAEAGSQMPGSTGEAPAVNGKAGAEGAERVLPEPAEERLEEPTQPESSVAEPAEAVKAESEEVQTVQQERQEALKLETTQLEPIRVQLAGAAKAQENGREPLRKERAEEQKEPGTEYIRVNLAEVRQMEAAPETVHQEPADTLKPAAEVPDKELAKGEEPVAAALLAADGTPANEGAQVREAPPAGASIPAEVALSEQKEAPGSLEEAVSGECDPAADQEAKPRTTNYSMFLWLQSHAGNRVPRDPEQQQPPQPSFFTYVSQLNQAQQSTDKRTKPEPFHILAMDRERSRKP
ncbi:cytosine deaminase [Paenibacillus thiaminolyticus]|uniref:cytosine deaminase n=1 Tax=Paenibacillus thiaminolyticus TaxID=49283 RepID=UPI00232DA2E1|nr:cytosine deaminase [Paenibacillus thiaminolyticus]WCF07159.1 cytosine deaminase [Paenibacillus thiaminolyticus]